MELAGFISIAILVAIQIGYFAYAFGKLYGRVGSIDKRLNDLTHSIIRIEERVGKMEGRK